MAKEKGIDNLLRNHAAYWPGEEAMAEGNPQKILQRGEARDLPPLLILQGTNDDNLPADMADRFAAAYREAAGEVKLEKFEGQPHTFITRDPASAASVRALALIRAFVAKQAARIL